MNRTSARAGYAQTKSQNDATIFFRDEVFTNKSDCNSEQNGTIYPTGDFAVVPSLGTG